jgi:hypothetical protein
MTSPACASHQPSTLNLTSMIMTDNSQSSLRNIPPSSCCELFELDEPEANLELPDVFTQDRSSLLSRIVKWTLEIDCEDLWFPDRHFDLDRHLLHLPTQFGFGSNYLGDELAGITEPADQAKAEEGSEDGYNDYLSIETSSAGEITENQSAKNTDLKDSKDLA